MVDINPSQVPAQLVDVAILEFGIVVHRIVVGLTLALDDAFKTLFLPS